MPERLIVGDLNSPPRNYMSYISSLLFLSYFSPTARPAVRRILPFGYAGDRPVESVKSCCIIRPCSIMTIDLASGLVPLHRASFEVKFKYSFKV